MPSHTVDYKVHSNLLECHGKREALFLLFMMLKCSYLFLSLTSKINISKCGWGMWCNALNHGASYFPVLPPPQMHSLPFSLFCTAGHCPSQAPCWLASGWIWLETGGQEKREVRDSFPAPLCFGHVSVRGCIPSGQQAMLGGTSHNSNNPSVQIGNSLPLH